MQTYSDATGALCGAAAIRDFYPKKTPYWIKPIRRKAQTSSCSTKQSRLVYLILYCADVLDRLIEVAFF